MLENLGKGGVSLADPEPKEETSPTLAGLTLVVTGALESMNREANPAGDCRPRRTVRVLGVRENRSFGGGRLSRGFQNSQAERLGTPILTEEEFLSLLEHGPAGILTDKA